MNREESKSVKKFQHHEKDTGSLEVQIVKMTERINELSDHFNSHAKDFSSRRGLLTLVNRRRKFLKYINKHNPERYKEIINNLGLRK